ncbi:MAG: M23 family metallopeptidase [Lachnospiraceae bacterium]|nr:M23 family metallopeptidase [Lachnospiraceae bacterium]
MNMRRNRNGIRKERIIMLASSALVLTALTVTGVFVRSNRHKEDEGNVVDFSVIENGVQENAENIMSDEELDTLFAEVGTDDLDYDPYFQEANSGHVENPGLTQSKKTAGSEADEESDELEEESGTTSKTSKKQDKQTKETKTDSDGSEEGMFDESEETMLREPEASEALAATVQPILNFGDEDQLVWPIVGNILINYSMDKTVYFPTLQQYKYNPAIVISATVGESIAAAAEGKVVSVTYDRELGNTVVMDLGNQYELTYGQLDNITVSEGSYVVTGDIIGSVASPTKYYSTEGANVYFKLTKNGEPVNPISKLK